MVVSNWIQNDETKNSDVKEAYSVTHNEYKAKNKTQILVETFPFWFQHGDSPRNTFAIVFVIKKRTTLE